MDARNVEKVGKIEKSIAPGTNVTYVRIMLNGNVDAMRGKVIGMIPKISEIEQYVVALDRGGRVNGALRKDLYVC